MLRRVLAPVLAGLAGLAAPSGAAQEAQPAASARPNVLLITLDTLRADHLACYGYERPTSPNLDRLAAQSTRYARARATAPWTLPSHASLFTGLYPFQHGVHETKVDAADPLVTNNVPAMSPKQLTLAEVLKVLGYQTAAVVANQGYLSRAFRLDQGFDHYDVKRTRVGGVNERVFAWLAERPAAKPFFLFVNTMDTHRPYNTRPRPGFLGREIPGGSGQLVEALYPVILSGKEPPQEQLATLRDQYDLAIANLDHGLGTLFGRLRELGLFDDSLIVVTSDHGEFFGEHALIEHSKDVYEPVLRVPLLIKLPGQQHGAVDERPISLAHVAGIVLDAVLAGSKSTLAEPLRQEWPAPALIAECHYSRLHDLRAPWGARFDRVRTVLYLDDLKYVRSSDGRHELFALDTDPGELRNALLEDPSRAAPFELQLDAWIARLGGAGTTGPIEPLDEALLRELKSLGY